MVRGRVLIAEDEGCLRRLLEELCESAGFVVDTVCEGRAAWALISSMPSAYTLVFLDLHMPGWSGDDVMGMLSMLNCPRRFVVIVSGLLDERMRKDFECHPNVFRILDKPFSTRDIADIFRVVLIDTASRDCPAEE
jgi:DNA-binding response OmpR family regulator